MRRGSWIRNSKIRKLGERSELERLLGRERCICLASSFSEALGTNWIEIAYSSLGWSESAMLGTL